MYELLFKREVMMVEYILAKFSYVFMDSRHLLDQIAWPIKDLLYGQYSHELYRGYYTAARRYEFYFRVVKQIFYERAQQVSKILFLPRGNKIHIFKPPCNFLFITDIDKRQKHKL